MGDLITFFANQEAVGAWVQSLGPAAPLGFILLQMAQTILAPIPGAVTGLVGGYLFGWWGAVLTAIGSSIGGLVVFWLSKKFGRPLIEKFFKPAAIEKFDFITGKHAAKILFITFLLPCFPDDMLCYLGGLTNLSIRKLMLILLLGHLPTFIVTNYIGMSIGQQDITAIIIVAVILALIAAAVYVCRESIMERLRKIAAGTVKS